MPAVVSSGSGTTLPVPGAGSTGPRGAAAADPGDFVTTLATLLAPTPTPTSAPTPLTGRAARGADHSAALPTGTTDRGPGSLLAGGLLAPDAPDGSSTSDTADAPSGGTADPNQALAQQVLPVPMTVLPALSAPATVVAVSAGGGEGVAGGTASVAATAAGGAPAGATPTAADASVPWAAAVGGAAGTTVSGPAMPPASAPLAVTPDGSAAAPASGMSGQTPGGSAASAATPLQPVGPAPTDATSGPEAVVVARSAVPEHRATDPSGAAGPQPLAAVAVPAVPTTSVVTGPVPAPPSAPTATPQPFAEQLSRPVLRLAAGAPGEHVLTLRVSPEHLGPVTVQAHIGADGVRIELFSGTEAGRAAVQAALPDLRRELAGTGLGASLDLSHRSHSGAPTHDPSAGEGRGERGDAGGQGREGARADASSRRTAARGPHASTPSQPSPTVAVLDVLA